MRPRAFLTLCLLSAGRSNPPPDTTWQDPSGSHQLSGPLCLAPGGTTIHGRKPVKVLMVPTDLEMSYIMAILLRERLGHPVELVNPLGSDAPPPAIMKVMQGCKTNGTSPAGSVCDRFGTPDLAVGVMDLQIVDFDRMTLGLDSGTL